MSEEKKDSGNKLPETGNVDPQTWDEIYDQFAGIENTALRTEEVFPPSNEPPNNIRQAGNFNRNNNRPSQTRVYYNRATTLTQYPGRELSIGGQDPVRQEVVR